MTEQDKGTTTPSHRLSLSSQEMRQMTGFVCALSMLGVMIDRFGTEYLRLVLNRELNDWDRFVYRVYAILAWLLGLWVQWWSNDRELWEAARRDAGTLG